MITITEQGLSYVQYETDGTTDNFVLTFPYLKQADLKVYLNGVLTEDFTWLNSSEIQMDTIPAADTLLTLIRVTEQNERLVDFQDGGVLKEETLDLDSNQLFYLAQEALDSTSRALAIDSTTSVIDAKNNRIINLADGIDDQDAVTIAQLEVVDAIADSAVVTANAANVKSDAAVATANGISATAASALSNANAAVVTANAANATAEDALDVANGIAATAATALSTANDAAADAAQAILDASAAQDTADAALGDASAAQSTADSAVAGLLLKENVANKDTDGTMAANSDILYPSQKATKTYVSSTVSTHAALTNTHGVSGAIVGTTSTQTLANKILTAPQINNGDIRTPSRSDIKQGTKAALDTYASTATNGQLCWATDLKQTYAVKDGLLVSVGAGSGSLDTIFQLVSDESLSNWSTGNSTSVLGGGTLAGTFAKETSTPLQGVSSYKFTQAAGSLNDYLMSESLAVANRFKGKEVTLFFPFKYDGADNDIEVVFYDATATNAAIIPSSTFIKTSVNATNSVSMFKSNIVIPLTCSNIRVGFQVKVLNSTKILHFDDVQLTSDSTVYASVNNPEELLFARVLTSAMTVKSANNFLRFPLASFSTTGLGILSEVDDGSKTKFVARKKCIVNIDMSVVLLSSGQNLTIVKNGTAIYDGVVGSGNGWTSLVSVNLPLEINDEITFRPTSDLNGGYVTASLRATVPSNQSILTAPETFSTDTAPLTFSSTFSRSTLPNAPIGTFITERYTANSRTLTQGSSAPTQTTTSMQTNGIQIFARPYNAASTDASPTRVSIQIGKGLKGVTLNGYGNTGRLLDLQLDYSIVNSSSISGLQWSYNEITGILNIDAGYNILTSTTSAYFQDFVTSTQPTSAYITINASKNPALTGIEILKNKIATLTDVKASGVDGGTATSGSYATRVLNTIVDPHGIITSLTSNQFVIPAGDYYIEASSPAFVCNYHKIKIQNITDGTVALMGAHAYASSADGGFNRSIVSGRISITSSKTFELQHRVSTTVASSGFGAPAAFSDDNIFSIVKITKIS